MKPRKTQPAATSDLPAPESVDRLEPLPWLPVLETGNQAIDDDHRAAVAGCNLVLDLIRARASWPALLDALRAARDRSIAHFEVEDRILRRTRYPEAARHRRAHLRILAEFNGIIAEMESVDVPEDRHWALALVPLNRLVDHCLRDDLKYKSHLMQYEPPRSR